MAVSINQDRGFWMDNSNRIIVESLKEAQREDSLYPIDSSIEEIGIIGTDTLSSYLANPFSYVPQINNYECDGGKN